MLLPGVTSELACAEDGTLLGRLLPLCRFLAFGSLGLSSGRSIAAHPALVNLPPAAADLLLGRATCALPLLAESEDGPGSSAATPADWVSAQSAGAPSSLPWRSLSAAGTVPDRPFPEVGLTTIFNI